MSAIFFEEKVGKDARVVDPDSVLFFRDHLTFLHKVMTQERIEHFIPEERRSERNVTNNVVVATS